MKQTIRFRGLSLNGDEQAAEHGDLSLCGNIELHDGALRQLQVYGPSLGGGNSLDGKVLFVHQTSSYTHFITSISGSLYWTEENDDHTSWKTEEIVVNSVTIESLRSINAIGNTLCILSETGLHYCLFKDGSYKYLGQQPPFLDIQFNLHLVDDGNTETITAKYDVESGGIISKEDDYAVTLGNDMIEFLNQDCKTSITEQVLAAINKRIDEKSGDGLFYAPFFVRYCYHLYDNSMIMHSCPVLMMPMLQHPVLTAIRGAMYKAENKYHAVNEFTDNELEFCVFVLCGKLQMKFLSNIVSDLKEWGDIVKSVDIFISNQFSRIDTSKPIEKINYLNEAEGIWSHFDGAQIQVGDYSGSSGLFHRTYPEFSVGDRTFYSACSFVLPEYGIEEYLSRIRGVSSFFKLASLNVDSLEHISNFTDVVFSPSAIMIMRISPCTPRT